MKEYKCNTCEKIFLQNIDLIRHKKRKNPCKKTSPNTTKAPPVIVLQKVIELPKIKKSIHQNSTKKKEYIVNKFECKYCNNYFSRIDSLNRHLDSRCKIKKEQESEKEIIFKKLLEKLDRIEKQNEDLRNEMDDIKTNNKIKNINNSTINNNTLDQSNNINNFHIQLVAFGKEDYDKLTEKEYKIIINKGYKSIQEMVKSLHFNKNRPENHNIYISNIRDNYVMIYDGHKWELRNRKETIEELYIAKKDILVDKFDELLNKLPEYAIDKFERFINDEQDDKIKESILEELKLILYNNKNIPLKTKERLGLLK